MRIRVRVGPRRRADPEFKCAAHTREFSNSRPIAPSSMEVREFAAVFVFRRSRCSTISRVTRADSSGGFSQTSIGRAQALLTDLQSPSVAPAARIKCLSVCRKIAADSSESVTIRDIVSAPIIVDAATNARRFATSGRVLPNSAAMMSTSSIKACVAAARVFSSHRAISLPRAISGQPAEGSSL